MREQERDEKEPQILHPGFKTIYKFVSISKKSHKSFNIFLENITLVVHSMIMKIMNFMSIKLVKSASGQMVYR